MSNAITTTNFSARLNGFSKSGTNMRKSAQEIIEFGFQRYLDTGDAGYLARLFGAAEKTKGINAKLILAYITDHANVKLSRNKDKSPKFNKVEKGIDAEVRTPDTEWWNYQKSTTVDPTIYVAKRINSIANAMAKADEAGKAVDMTDIRSALNALQDQIDMRLAEDKPELSVVNG